MPEESVCRTQSSDRAVGRRFFTIVSGSQYFSGNQERLPACQPQKVLLTDRYRRLWCRDHRAFAVWKDPVIRRKADSNDRAADRRDHAVHWRDQGRERGTLHHQADGKDEKKPADQTGETKWYFQKRWCCDIWTVRSGQAFCGWKSFLQKFVPSHKNAECCGNRTERGTKIFRYVCQVSVSGWTDRRKGNHFCNGNTNFQQHDRIIYQHALSAVWYAAADGTGTFWFLGILLWWNADCHRAGTGRNLLPCKNTICQVLQSAGTDRTV